MQILRIITCQTKNEFNPRMLVPPFIKKEQCENLPVRYQNNNKLGLKATTRHRVKRKRRKNKTYLRNLIRKKLKVKDACDL